MKSLVLGACLLALPLASCISVDTNPPPATTRAGDLDKEFSSDGKVALSAKASFGTLLALGIDGEGRIWATGGAGANRDVTQSDRSVILRLLSNGDADGSFGSSGLASIASSDGARVVMSAIVLGTDQGAYLAGTRTGAGSVQSDAIAAQITSTGEIEKNFGESGFSVIERTDTQERIEALAIDAQKGRLLLVGSTTSPARAQSPAPFVAGLASSNGAVDKTFGKEGLFEGANPASVTSLQLRAIAPLSGGDWLAAGRGLGSSGLQVPTLARFSPAGASETSWGRLSFVVSQIPQATAEWQSVAADDSGRIWAAGTAYKDGRLSVAVARFAANGDVDTGFGQKGFLVFAVGERPSQARSLVVDPAGAAAWVAGEALDASGMPVGYVAKVTSDGKVDTDFAVRGFRTVSYFSGGSSSFYAMKRDSLGRLVVVGYASQDASSRGIAVARILP